MPTPESPLGAADYDLIEAAVMETWRGRWFLAEYAQRNRHADTGMLLEAMQRLEKIVRQGNLVSVERVRTGLADVAAAIDTAKAELAAEADDAAGKAGPMGSSAGATADILAAVEQIQEIAWRMREQGLDRRHCDALETRATDIYTACFAERRGDRGTRKATQVLRGLESRIEALTALWEPPARGETSKTSIAEAVAIEDHFHDAAATRVADAYFEQEAIVSPAALPEKNVPLQPADEGSRAAAPAQAPRITVDPLAPLAAMSYAQRIALFT